MFSWCNACETQPAGSGYLVKKDKQPPKFYPKFTDIKETDLQDRKVSVLKINKSQYDTFHKGLTGKQQKFVDQDFPPSDKSLGKFQNIKTDRWKRLSQILPNITYFNKEILPFDAVSTNSAANNIGFQAAIAALAENPERVANLQGKAVINPNGIYTFLLRHKAKIEEVIIDDYVPVNQKGQPIFTKPAKSAVWVALLQKARAKLYGSYENMQRYSQDPRSTLQQLTFAPVDTLKGNGGNKDEYWNRLAEARQRGNVCLGLTSKSETINWSSIDLTPNHYYSIIDVCQMPHKMGSFFRVMKLRNAFKHQEYKGEGSLADNLFWDQIQNCEMKAKMLSSTGSKQGVIYMLFSDYLKYFDETLINYYENARNYNNQPCEFISPNGMVYDLTVSKEGYYSFFIEQDKMQPQKKGLQYVQQGWSRSTMLIFKNESAKNFQNYQFLNGILKYNQKSAHIRSKLAVGNYVLYVKLDPTIKNSNFPKNTNLATYSTQAVQLKPSLQQKYPSLLKTAFLAHGRSNKRQKYNNDLMWSSWKLIVQGGYAYIAFGNSFESKSKFVIKFKQEVFNQQNYILKKPFKGRGGITLEVLPGHQEIILLRIKNSQVKQINFPPPIDLQIIPS